MPTVKLLVDCGNSYERGGKFFFRNFKNITDHFNFVTTPDPDYVLTDLYTTPSITKNPYEKILWAKEYINVLEHPRLMDEWFIGWQYEEDITSYKYRRFPNYFLHHGAGKNLIKTEEYDPQKIISEKREFCNFIYCSNVPIRNKFMNYLSKYKHVHAPGPCCQNTAPVAGYKTAMASRLSENVWNEKINYLQYFKFTIAFENQSVSGYTSEKIYHAMLANSIPIYWGNPDVYRDFNPKAFINAHDYAYKDNNDLCEYLLYRVKEIDQDDNKYLEMLSQPWYNNNQVSAWTDENRYLDFFKLIFTKVY